MAIRRMSINVVAGAASNLTSAALGLLTIPYLVRQLGVEAYGVWALVVLIVSYLTLMDFGVTIATGRLMAARRALNDREGIDRIAISAFAICAAIALLCALLAYGISLNPGLLFNIPPERLPEAQQSIVYSGLAVGAYFLFAPLTCILWAYERFDIIGAVEIVVQSVRAAFIFTLIAPGSKIVDLALITFGGHLLSGIILLVICWYALPTVRLEPRLFTFGETRELLRQGLSFFALNASRALPGLAALTIIGNQMNPVAVTAYSVARQLVTYSHALVMAASQGAASRAVAYFATDELGKQRQLYSFGAILTTAVAFFITGGFVALGLPFMQLWQGGRLDHAYDLLVILAVGEALPMSQWVTYSILVGMGQHARLIVISLVESAVVLVGGLITADIYGLEGVCVVLAVTATIFRGALLWLLGVKVLDRSVRYYLLRTVAPLAILVLVLTAIYLKISSPTWSMSWISFSIAAAVYSASFAMTFLAAFRLRLIRAEK